MHPTGTSLFFNPSSALLLYLVNQNTYNNAFAIKVSRKSFGYYLVIANDSIIYNSIRLIKFFIYKLEEN